MENVALFLFIVISFAILNRARGTKLWDTTSSTVIGRLVATCGMAALTTCLFSDLPLMKLAGVFLSTELLLMLWVTPAWDAYWSAEIGNDPAHTKWWGVWHMSLRMLLASPIIINVAFLSDHPVNALLGLLTPLFSVPYVIFGLGKKSDSIMWSEYTVGAMFGALIYLTVSL